MALAPVLWALRAGTAQEAAVSPGLGHFPGSDQSPFAGGRDAGSEGQLPRDPRQVRPLRQGEHWPTAFPE